MPQVYKHIPINLQNHVMACLRRHLAQANAFFHTNYTEPNILYRPKGSIAGSAYLTRWEIQLNRTLLCENGIPFIEEVVPHELAHLLVYKQFGKVKPHGKEWQSIMATVLGKEPKTTHNFTVSRPDYLYVCQCQTHHLSKIRHNKIQQQHIDYICKKCGTILKLQ
ncbi:SprT family zinc-dependent metalloprotease [Orbaceae bacterium ESL0727]|nr:SprT family zinc-dependent metalloprotease [Orbaceae bacterium ESL0727]